MPGVTEPLSLEVGQTLHEMYNELRQEVVCGFKLETELT